MFEIRCQNIGNTKYDGLTICPNHISNSKKKRNKVTHRNITCRRRKGWQEWGRGNRVEELAKNGGKRD